jgi:hypothetical protein
MRFPIGLILTAFLLAVPTTEQEKENPIAKSLKDARTVSYCDMVMNPGKFDRTLIRITGFVTHGFEDFSFGEPHCSIASDRFSVWLTFGGNVQSNTIYCCPGEWGNQRRGQPLKVDGVPVPLVEDKTLAQFQAVIEKENNTVVRATLIGQFLSGEKQSSGTSSWWGGYGHMGCCSLLIIQKVEGFEGHIRTDVDYSNEGGWYEEVGCEAQSMRYPRHVNISFGGDAARKAIAEQSAADAGTRTWAFSDPVRVATEAFQHVYSGTTPSFRKIKTTSVRHVFRWRRGKRIVNVVVTRPYRLSFYSKTGHVVWVASTLQEAVCQ